MAENVSASSQELLASAEALLGRLPPLPRRPVKLQPEVIKQRTVCPLHWKR